MYISMPLRAKSTNRKRLGRKASLVNYHENPNAAIDANSPAFNAFSMISLMI